MTAATVSHSNPPPTWSHRVEYLATRATVAVLRLLPWRAASAIGGALGRLAYRPFGIRAGVVERQIAAAFPHLTPEAVRQLAAQSYDNLGRLSIEMAVLPGTTREELVARVPRVHGWEHVEAAFAQGKGVIGVTAHLGNWEVGAAYLAARGLPVDAVTRGAANKLFEAYLARTRRAIGMEVINDRDAVRRTPRSLRDNRMVGFVADHDALGLASTFVPFFGRPAKTPRGPAVFALRFGAPVLFIIMVRDADGEYTLHVKPVEVTPTGDREADVDAIVLRFTQMLEDMVRDYPGQYFWQHRRWRRQPPDTPPHLREP
jgi:Kdo2-lipid IVA lauroyltransferase/acyltransferase